MSVSITFDQFMHNIGLLERGERWEHQPEHSIVEEAFAATAPLKLSRDELTSMYTYKVPKQTTHGGCSRKKIFEEQPHNLATDLYDISYECISELQTHAATARLWKLNQVIRRIQEVTKVHWVGIYKLYPDRHEEDGKPFAGLVKEAYHGEASRAVFPLSPSYAGTSNNSWVAINGKAKLLQDTRAYDGPYYECSARVESELCVPILDPQGNAIGIIDAEAWEKNFFTPEVTAEIVRICQDLGKVEGF